MAGSLVSDRRQRILLSRTLFGATGYLVAYLVLVVTFLIGRMDVTGLTLGVAISISFCFNIVFVALIVTDWNVRLFRDPGMTFAQVLCGLLWMLWAVWAAPEARGLMSLLVIPSFIFGIFKLGVTEQLVLTAIVSIGYGAIVLADAIAGQGDLVVAISYWLVITLMLSWLSFVSGYVSQLRQRLREQTDALKSTRDRLAKLAVTDELTGLFNRRHMNTAMEKERIRALRYDKPLSLAIFDIDHFKPINDNFGHAAGDEVLQTIALRLNEMVRGADWIGRGTDAIGRVGGEEFILMLPETDHQQAQECAERLRRAIGDKPFRINRQSLPITVSVGVATLRPNETLAQLIERADRSLYQAKHDGRNRVVADSS